MGTLLLTSAQRAQHQVGRELRRRDRQLQQDLTALRVTEQRRAQQPVRPQPRCEVAGQRPGIQVRARWSGRQAVPGRVVRPHLEVLRQVPLQPRVVQVAARQARDQNQRPARGRRSGHRPRRSRRHGRCAETAGLWCHPLRHRRPDRWGQSRCPRPDGNAPRGSQPRLSRDRAGGAA